MAKMTAAYRQYLRGVLKDAVKQFVDAAKDDDGKWGHPAVMGLLAEDAGVASYEVSNVMFLENVRIYWHKEIIIDTHNGGWVGYYFPGHYDERGYQDREPEMVKVPLPRKYRGAICNAIKLFASEQWKHAIAKFGSDI